MIDNLALEVMELKEFAEETSQKIREYDLYVSLGIVSEDMRNGMERNIVDRMAYTVASIAKIRDVMECYNRNK